ncbi:MAG: TetR/AcrR family transcriptional regulator [Fibrobacterales bacterium]
METRKEKNRRRNVEDILNATAHLIAEKGITNISVDDIAKKADFGKGTLYNYFKNKEDIIWSLVEKVFSEFLSEISQTVKVDGHIVEKMTQVLTISHDYFLKQVALNEILAFLEYSSWQVQNSEVFNKSCQFFDTFHAPFVEMFEQAMERGEIQKTDARFLSISFFTNLSAIKKCMIRGMLSDDDTVVSELLMNSFFKEL